MLIIRGEVKRKGFKWMDLITGLCTNTPGEVRGGGESVHRPSNNWPTHYWFCVYLSWPQLDENKGGTHSLVNSFH